MSVKAILLDIDGTLVNGKKEITPETQKALLKAQKQGIKLILASGRPTQGLMDMARKLEMDRNHGLLVSYNGAKVVDAQTGEELFSQTMSAKEAREVLEHLKKFKAVPLINKGRYAYVDNVFNNTITVNGEKRNILEYEARSNHYRLCELDMAQEIDFPVAKILTYADPEYLQAVYKEMAEPFFDRLNCMFTAPFYVEYTAQGVDKAKALNTVLGPMGIAPEETIGFGDAQNDLSMLNYAGTAVAMGNAVPEVKEIADYITLDNEHDGIAHALYHFIPELKTEE